MEVNIDLAMTHSTLLELMFNLELSRSTILRIIYRINSTKESEKLMPLEEEYISLLQQCKTEQEVLAKLDEKGW